MARWPCTPKALQFDVLAGDAAVRGVVVVRALIANHSTVLTAADIVRIAAAAHTAHTSRLPAAVATRLTPAQARWFAGAWDAADQAAEPQRSVYQLLILKLFLRQFPLSLPSATDAPHAAAGDFDAISPRRLGHYLRVSRAPSPTAVERTAAAVNAGVFPGRGTALQGDARTVIAETAADVVLLDPPYGGTTGYAAAYAAIDALLGDSADARPPTVDELLDASRASPWVVLTYGGPRTTRDDLVRTVARHRTVVEAHAVPYRHLAAIASKEKNASNQEFVLLARR